jgi:predicted esterase
VRLGALFGIGVVGALAFALAPEPVRAETADSDEFCAPELESLAGGACYAAPKQHAANEPKTLVLFLHSLVGARGNWQWEQQRTLARVGERSGMSVLMPRGRLGIGPGRKPDVWAWPTSHAAEQTVEPEVLAEWVKLREEVTRRHGEFERTFVMGFSNGAYYATSLAVRAQLDADGYAVFAGGSGSRWIAARARATTKRRAPIFIGYGTRDAARHDARALANLLGRLKWPHRVRSADVGHTVTNDQLDRAVAYLKEASSPPSD